MEKVEEMFWKKLRSGMLMEKKIVEMEMIESIINIMIERRKIVIIEKEKMGVEIGRGKLKIEDIVMEMKERELVIGRKEGEMVRGGKVELIGDEKNKELIFWVVERKK